MGTWCARLRFGEGKSPGSSVGTAAGGADILEHDRLRRLPQGDDEQDLVALRDLEGCARIHGYRLMSAAEDDSEGVGTVTGLLSRDLYLQPLVVLSP